MQKTFLLISAAIFSLCAQMVFYNVAAFAQDASVQKRPSLLLPIDCTLNEDCWLLNYVDIDTLDGKMRDFQCGPRTYDQHGGVDFAVRDRLAMETGVNVLAAASGRVLRVRNDVPDAPPVSFEEYIKSQRGKDCGNGLIMELEDTNWQLQYCHFKEGSITFSPGDRVYAGDAIGEVGQSGVAEAPHVHMTVRHNGKIIDPFTGLTQGNGCQAGGRSLWKDKIPYDPVNIYAAGFKGHQATFDEVKIDASPTDTISIKSKALTLWVTLWGVRQGDTVTMTIKDPKGNVFVAQKHEQARDRARQFYVVGWKIGQVQLMPGEYTGTIRLRRERQGQEPLKKEKTVKVTVVK